MPIAWARRTRELHDELAAIADVTSLGPTWWLVAGTAAAAEPLPARAAYVVSDAEPNGDTFIGHRSPPPDDPIVDALARAHAARAALRELDGQLPDQPLAITIARGDLGARTVPSSLEVAAFAIGDTIVLARLGDRIEDDGNIVARLVEIAHMSKASQIVRVVGGASNASRFDSALSSGTEVPFACVSIGEDRLTVARHGHRRAWRDGAGPWLGLGRAGSLATTSTCHMVVDGYGHAWLAARIAEHHARVVQQGQDVPRVSADDLPLLALVPDAIPLGVAWRELPSPAPRALRLGYALGRVLHRVAGKPDARFSPTFQIPIAPGAPDDPDRIMRRVVPSTISVRFDRGEPEPFEAFAERARAILAREAAGRGLCSRLLTAARAVPVPLAFKRRSFTAARSGVFDRIAEVLGGRACLSKIRLATPVPLSCAVSSPARLATKSDPVGGCVLTIVEDGTRTAITACGSGLAGSGDDAADLIDAVLELADNGRD